jgi:hypothetical protein
MTIATTSPKATLLTRLIARVGAWSLAAAITVLSLVPVRLRPETGTPHNFEHFAIFCATGLAFSIGYPGNRPNLTVRLVIFAGAIEVAQLFVSERHARIGDFVVDASALVIGVALAAFAVRVFSAQFATSSDRRG